MKEGVFHTFRPQEGGRGMFYGWFEAMHSRFDLLLCDVDEPSASALCRRIADETRRIGGRLDRFDAHSDLRRFDEGPCGEYLCTDAEMLAFFTDALRYRRLTEGAFDVCFRTPAYDGATECFRIDAARDAVVKLVPQTVFDFGGYAKGYALERARAAVVSSGVERALLSFGNSSVCAVGTHPSGHPWRVGVENPLRRGESMTTVELCDAAIERSGGPHGPAGGDQQQGFLAGQRPVAEIVQFSAAEQQFGRREESEVHVRIHKRMFRFGCEDRAKTPRRHCRGVQRNLFSGSRIRRTRHSARRRTGA